MNIYIYAVFVQLILKILVKRENDHKIDENKNVQRNALFI